MEWNRVLRDSILAGSIQRLATYLSINFIVKDRCIFLRVLLYLGEQNRQRE